MKISNVKLPSNKKFGFFFTIITSIIGIYFFYNKNINITYIAFTISLLFFLITIFNADLLLPFNKIWMHFGLILGIIINPIVLGLIFFTIFTPVGVITRLFNRDELKLKFIKRSTYWKNCIIKNNDINDFKKQF